MKVTIDTNDLSVNERGELLRGLVFDQKVIKSRSFGEYRETGCYHTFDLRDGFAKIEPEKYPEVFKLFDVYDGYFDDIKVSAYESKDIVAMWYWDGDGDLLIWIKGDAVAYENSDCKKDYTWQEVKIVPTADSRRKDA